ncbi:MULTISPECIES: inositol 2-dehydrogenase [Yersinia pseudotuberculosis complex]|uniref:Oxidoreductase, NAD-binding n=1 Tax=Yersinia pseudotuberculosis serotype O:1b (strain IP 31758) TaxID=349747 RepID=A0A0U1QZC7_YERP3|nr:MULTISPECIES: inositol 2-dehydrogenase [Yersinia pseudotuberculosis complex]ABS48138.1 oxidoreductase, NAD-binding [Yersinia pseudotuberculosis IP 31758]AJK16788.1 inositol 2-dehydrogenase [Yersinia pseudotuberculosis str. PA3606]MCE4111752.1 inositol 2-dehydrogenase [Yersinia pseudotuberculosis]MCF1163910.1 inositol 2-dehydrogenase [Yersinia pseudotuberculosis]UFA62651.1 Myo-inositol 2-dehydrogenase [Yersinia pseudotuberculosis]
MFNIALLGAGRIGQVHAANIAAHPETTLWSVVDPNQENAARLVSQYRTRQQSVNEAMADLNVHAVLIASATDTHADLIELAAKHGKTIFCEKPVHLDLARVRDCLKVVKEYGVPLFVGFNRRFDPQFRHLKNEVLAGRIGKPESLLIISRDPSPPPVEYVRVSGGMFRDMTIHDFDMARFIMGEEPVAVFAQGSNLVDPAIGAAGDIDTAFVVLKYASGAMATIVNSRRSAYGYDQRLELHGSQGLLCVGNILENQVQHFGQKGGIRALPEHFFLQRYQAAYVAEWEHFVAVLRGDVQPECGGEEGKRALYLADKALESLHSQREISL